MTDDTAKTKVPVATLKSALGYTKPGDNAVFMRDWKELPEQDKEQLRAGIADGSMTY